MIDKLKSKDSLAIILRFWKRWALMDQLAKKRMMMKYTQAIMSRTRLNEQGCFWRWKFQMKYGFMPVEPRHVICFKKMQRVRERFIKKVLRAAYFRILLDTRPVSTDRSSGRYTVDPELAKHMQRFVGRFTPQPEEMKPISPVKGKPAETKEEELIQDQTAPVEALMGRLKKSLLGRINSVLLRSVKGSFMKWKYHGFEVDRIAGKMNEDLPESEYHTLVCSGASRLLIELFTRSLHRKLERIFGNWYRLSQLPKEMSSIKELVDNYDLLKGQNEEL